MPGRMVPNREREEPRMEVFSLDRYCDESLNVNPRHGVLEG